MPVRTVAQHLLDFLAKYEVDTLYGVTGDAVFPIFDALGNQNSIRYIGASNEANAAFMASYQAKLTGRLGVCVATSGPGTANLVNGLADAYFDGAPVLAITGQIASDKIGTGAKQDVNQQELLQAVTTSSQLAVNPTSVLSVVARAVETAISKKTVAHVAIPQDILSQTLDTSLPEIDVRALTDQTTGYAGPLDQVISALENCNNPVIVFDNKDKSLKRPLEELANRLGAGIILTQQSKGLLPDEHPLVLGGMGEAYVPALLSELDCRLQVGSSSFEQKYFPTNSTIIQLVDKPSLIDFKETHLAISGNIGEILTAIKDHLQQKDNQYWQEKIKQEKANRKNIIQEQKSNLAQPIHPGYLMSVLSETIPQDAVIVSDIGAFAHWFDSFFEAHGQTVLISSHWRSMGSGFPGALGAALNTDKPVIALVGDGGLTTALGEIPTAAKHDIPVTVVVANNFLYELERTRMEHQGQNPVGVDILTPDFAAVACHCGAQGKQIKNPQELKEQLSEAIGSTKPTIVDVHLAQVPLPFA